MGFMDWLKGKKNPSPEQQATERVSSTRLSKDEALAIAQKYQAAYQVGGALDHTAQFSHYPSFENVDGSAWLIEALLPPSTFEGTGTLTYVVGEKTRAVQFIINPSGFYAYPHQDNSATEFTDEDLEDWDSEDDDDDIDPDVAKAFDALFGKPKS